MSKVPKDSVWSQDTWDALNNRLAQIKFECLNRPSLIINGTDFNELLDIEKAVLMSKIDIAWQRIHELQKYYGSKLIKETEAGHKRMAEFRAKLSLEPLGKIKLPPMSPDQIAAYKVMIRDYIDNLNPYL